MSEKQHITTFSADIEQQTVKKVVWRILPFLIVCYLIAIIDRGNIGMASLQMNEDLGLSKAVFGFASSLFFVGYFLFEVPSNLAMQKIGAKIWISRIMVSWGIISVCTAFVESANTLYVLRFLLGAAEAGFFPGVILYLTYWIPGKYRARVIATFMVAIPAANFIGSPVSGLILSLDGWLGMRGWHWLFILEGIPAVILGIAAFFLLSNRPTDASWLNQEQKNVAEHDYSGRKREEKSDWSYLAMAVTASQAYLGDGTDLCGGFCGGINPERLVSATAEIVRAG